VKKKLFKKVLLFIFGLPQKEKEYIYIYSEEIQKIIRVRKGCWNAEKKSKLIEEVQKYKSLKFDSIFLIDESSVNKKI
jgi:hypothetical protein